MCNRFSFFLNRSSYSHYLHFSPSQQHNCPTWQRHAGRRWRRLHFFRPKRLSGCVSLPFCLLFILSRSCCIQVVVTTCCPSLFSHAYTSMFRFEFNACRQRLHWLVAPSRPSSLGEIKKSRRTIEMLQSHTHACKYCHRQTFSLPLLEPLLVSLSSSSRTGATPKYRSIRVHPKTRIQN